MAFWAWMTHVGLVIFILTDLFATLVAILELHANRKELRDSRKELNKHHEKVIELINGKEGKKEEP